MSRATPQVKIVNQTITRVRARLLKYLDSAISLESVVGRLPGRFPGAGRRDAICPSTQVIDLLCHQSLPRPRLDEHPTEALLEQFIHHEFDWELQTFRKHQWDPREFDHEFTEYNFVLTQTIPSMSKKNEIYVKLDGQNIQYKTSDMWRTDIGILTPAQFAEFISSTAGPISREALARMSKIPRTLKDCNAAKAEIVALLFRRNHLHSIRPCVKYHTTFRNPTLVKHQVHLIWYLLVQITLESDMDQANRLYGWPTRTLDSQLNGALEWIQQIIARNAKLLSTVHVQPRCRFPFANTARLYSKAEETLRACVQDIQTAHAHLKPPVSNDVSHTPQSLPYSPQ